MQLQLYSPNLTGAVRTRSDRLGAVGVMFALSSRLRHSSRLRRRRWCCHRGRLSLVAQGLRCRLVSIRLERFSSRHQVLTISSHDPSVLGHHIVRARSSEAHYSGPLWPSSTACVLHSHCVIWFQHRQRLATIARS